MMLQSIYLVYNITINIIFSDTYYLEPRNAIVFIIVHLILYQQNPNWLFGHYRTLLTSLLGKKLH